MNIPRMSSSRPQSRGSTSSTDSDSDIPMQTRAAPRVRSQSAPDGRFRVDSDDSTFSDTSDEERQVGLSRQSDEEGLISTNRPRQVKGKRKKASKTATKGQKVEYKFLSLGNGNGNGNGDGDHDESDAEEERQIAIKQKAEKRMKLILIGGVILAIVLIAVIAIAAGAKGNGGQQAESFTSGSVLQSTQIDSQHLQIGQTTVASSGTSQGSSSLQSQSSSNSTSSADEDSESSSSSSSDSDSDSDEESPLKGTGLGRNSTSANATLPMTTGLRPTGQASLPFFNPNTLASI